MILYTHPSVIPGPAPAADTAAAVPAKPNADGDTAIAGSPPPSPSPIEQPDTAPRQAICLAHTGWAVTEFGLESVITAGDPPRLVEYLIDKERLLQVEHGTAGVSRWAVQLAGKSWLADPFGLLEAIEAALRHHHPGQAVIDLAATRGPLLDKWARTRPRPKTAAGASDTLEQPEPRPPQSDQPRAEPDPTWLEEEEAEEEDLPLGAEWQVEEIIEDGISRRHSRKPVPDA